jgi:hypothetical protein
MPRLSKLPNTTNVVMEKEDRPDMTIELDNETWIIEAGDAIIQKSAEQGGGALTPLERLIYCLWVADYGMRNAGDLTTAHDVYPSFHDEAARLSRELALPLTHSAFGLHRSDLEQCYFEVFDQICNEIRAAPASN